MLATRTILLMTSCIVGSLLLVGTGSSQETMRETRRGDVQVSPSASRLMEFRNVAAFPSCSPGGSASFVRGGNSLK